MEEINIFQCWVFKYIGTGNLIRGHGPWTMDHEGRMIETSLKLTKSTIRLSLVRLCLSLDFSWYDRKQVLQDLSLVKHTSILCLSILDKCPNALDCHLD